MKKLIFILYVPLFLIANAVAASEADKLEIYATPRPAITVPVTNENGDAFKFGESSSALRIVNLWAIWCIPCRKEMPTLDVLSEKYHPAQIAVLTVATGRNEPAKVAEFFKDIGVKNLPVYYDPKQKFASAAGAVGLPHTIFLNAKGEEIARVIGGANYTDPELAAKIDALLKAQN